MSFISWVLSVEKNVTNQGKTVSNFQQIGLYISVYGSLILKTLFFKVKTLLFLFCYFVCLLE